MKNIVFFLKLLLFEIPCSIFDIQNIKEAESHSKRHCKCDSFQPQAEPTISDLALRSRFSRKEAEHSYGDASILITTRVRSSSDLRPKVKLFSSPYTASRISSALALAW